LKTGYQNSSKYDREDIPLNDQQQQSYNLAVSWVKRKYNHISGTSVLTSDEAIAALDKTTTVGSVFCERYKNKRQFLDSPDAAVLEKYWCEVQTDNPVPAIFKIAQKHEIRKNAKVESGDVRTFCAAPVMHIWATNRMCNNFNEKFYEQAPLAEEYGTSSFVGDSKFLQGWNSLWLRLSGHNKEKHNQFKTNCFELDETQFDASITKYMMETMRDFRFEFLSQDNQTDKNKLIMKNLYHELIHTVMELEDGVLIRKETGNPSGSSNTVVDNTLILEVLFAFAFIEICTANNVKFSYTTYVENVISAMYGDDNTYTVTDDYLFFNPERISEIWTSIGVVTKTPCQEPRKIEDCEFLSTSFHFNEEYMLFMPKPDTNKVLSSLMMGGKGVIQNDVRWQLLRASAMRVESFGNPECKKLLEQYKDFIWKNYKNDLRGTCNGISMERIKNLWHSDSFLNGLFFGLESKNVSAYENTWKGIAY
jgi:hypothetical protein